MDGRRHTSVRQLEILVEFADSHRDLALARLRSKEARALAKRLWMECAEMLNCEGPARSPQEWTKVWNVMKSRVRAASAATTNAAELAHKSFNAQTSRTALDESRAMVMRIEELRARTDNMVAQAALNQSQAAKAQSEAALMQAQAVSSLCQAVASLVPAMELYLKREARKRIRRVSSSDKD